MDQLTLFDSAPESVALERKHPLSIPDDLTVIRNLLSLEDPTNEECAMEKAEEYAHEQMEGKFDMYDDAPADIDEYEEHAKDTIRNVFWPIWKILVDIQEMFENRNIGSFLQVNEANAEYAAYLYNLNAPYHQKEPIPYQKLTKIFQEFTHNN